ncbi:MAG TPA: hypothetical protein DCQ98_20340, partial [Planctomycetaceae bacterium]|nr:hypothetical protein [Planctomycetaceae bacterium]
MTDQKQDCGDARIRLSSIDAPRPTGFVSCSHLVRPLDKLHLVSPSGEACELMARKDGKGRVYIVVRSRADRPY